MDVPGSRSRGRSKIFMAVVKEEVEPAGVRMQRRKVKWRRVCLQPHLKETARTNNKKRANSEANANRLLVLKRITTVPPMCYKTKPRGMHVECVHTNPQCLV